MKLMKKLYKVSHLMNNLNGKRADNALLARPNVKSKKQSLQIKCYFLHQILMIMVGWKNHALAGRFTFTKLYCPVSSAWKFASTTNENTKQSSCVTSATLAKVIKRKQLSANTRTERIILAVSASIAIKKCTIKQLLILMVNLTTSKTLLMKLKNSPRCQIRSKNLWTSGKAPRKSARSNQLIDWPSNRQTRRPK